MRLKIDRNEVLGVKKLSPAELSTNETSNQTHIGLMEKSFLFLKDAPKESPSLVYYDGKIIQCATMYTRILRKSGVITSPRINAGPKNQDSVLHYVRARAASAKINTRWYLVCATLIEKKPCFILFNDQSNIFDNLSDTDLLDPDSYETSKPKWHHIDGSKAYYWSVVKYLEDLLNSADYEGDELDLETAVIAGDYDSSRYSPRDIEEARRRASETGREGEMLIDRYLNSLKETGEIRDYVWMNKKEESYKPYDFEIVNNDKETLYVDVKTTDYGFDRPVVFSANEVKYIDKCPTYKIFRVFKNKGRTYLRICSNAREHFSKIHNIVEAFKKSSDELMHVFEMSISIQPSSQPDIIFEEQIEIDMDSINQQ